MSRAALMVSAVLLLLGGARRAQALAVELTAAGSYEKADSRAAEHGVSARARINTFSGSRFQLGGSLFANLAGDGLSVYDVVAGAGFRTAGAFYLDVGGGVRHSNLWGTGIALWGGGGVELSAKIYLSLPVIVRLNHTIEYTPYVGYRF